MASLLASDPADSKPIYLQMDSGQHLLWLLIIGVSFSPVAVRSSDITVGGYRIYFQLLSRIIRPSTLINYYPTASPSNHHGYSQNKQTQDHHQTFFVSFKINLINIIIIIFNLSNHMARAPEFLIISPPGHWTGLCVQIIIISSQEKFVWRHRQPLDVPEI